MKTKRKKARGRAGFREGSLLLLVFVTSLLKVGSRLRVRREGGALALDIVNWYGCLTTALGFRTRCSCRCWFVGLWCGYGCVGGKGEACSR